MNVTTRMKMDLRQPDVRLRINAVQGDCYSRSIEIALYSGIVPWIIPEGTTVAVRYQKSDGTKGYYDTLPNGDAAWTVQDNLLTIKLAPQVLTSAGSVLVQIEMIQGVKMLSTFGVTIDVEANPAVGWIRSEDYINWLQWIKDQSAEHTKMVEQSAHSAIQAAKTAKEAASSAETLAGSADTFAGHARESAASAQSAVDSAFSIRDETSAIAAKVSAIVAGNEAYTKKESDQRYCPAIVQTVTGESIAIHDRADAPLVGLKLLGKTAQGAVPSPEAPVDSVSAGATGQITVTIKGESTEQSLIVSTPNGLPGIPVSTGGNYTDGTGQQWICDELDIVRGKYVKRIGIANFSNLYFYVAENGGYPVGDSLFFKARIYDNIYTHKNILCSKLPFATDALNKDINGCYALYDCVYCRIQGVSDIASFNTHMAEAVFLYILATPEEIDLSDGSFPCDSNFSNFHAEVSITNDTNAGMEICYVADTQKYIENKLVSMQ